MVPHPLIHAEIARQRQAHFTARAREVGIFCSDRRCRAVRLRCAVSAAAAAVLRTYACRVTATARADEIARGSR
jgi:hypothetical protein